VSPPSAFGIDRVGRNFQGPAIASVPLCQIVETATGRSAALDPPLPRVVGRLRLRRHKYQTRTSTGVTSPLAILLHPCSDQAQQKDQEDDLHARTAFKFEVVHAVVGSYGNHDTPSSRPSTPRSPRQHPLARTGGTAGTDHIDRTLLHAHRVIDAVISLADRAAAAGDNRDQEP
jgi:hypothetical protein